MKIELPFDQWLEVHNQINEQVETASVNLREFKHLAQPNGLLPDDVRTSPSYQNAKKVYELAFSRLRNFNQNSPKEYLRQASKIHRGY